MNTLRLLEPGATDILEVLRFAGTERLGAPYAMDLLVVAPPGGSLPVHARARLDLENGRTFQGVLSLWEPTAPGRFRARLVPRLWLLSRVRRTRPFPGRTLQELLAGLLEEEAVPAGFHLDPEAHPLREYRCQYSESALDLLRRSCEREGVTFFFRQEDGEERVIFAEGPAFHPVLAGALSMGGSGALESWTCRNLPPVLHPDSGARAEARQDFLGVGARGPGAGWRFHLEGHARPAFNQEYLTLEVAHGGGKGRPSRSRFRAMPLQGARVPQGTRASRVEGILRARTGPGLLDGRGLYGLGHPWQDAGEVPIRVPMTQPFLGPGSGWHFPLEAGTEVALGFQGGDPERPFILGAMGLGAREEGEPTLRSRGGRALTLGKDHLGLASGQGTLAMGAARDTSDPEASTGGFTVRTPGMARWWAEGDVGRFTFGLRLDATSGASSSVMGISGLDLALGPRVDFYPGTASTAAITTLRHVRGTDFHWAASSRRAAGWLCLSARPGVRNLEVLFRVLFALSVLPPLLGKVQGVQFLEIFFPSLAFLAALLAEWRNRGAGRGVALLMASPVPVFLGSPSASGNFMALVDERAEPPVPGFGFLGGRFQTLDTPVEGWVRDLPRPAGIPMAVHSLLATDRSALVMRGDRGTTSCQALIGLRDGPVATTVFHLASEPAGARVSLASSQADPGNPGHGYDLTGAEATGWTLAALGEASMPFLGLGRAVWWARTSKAAVTLMETRVLLEGAQNRLGIVQDACVFRLVSGDIRMRLSGGRMLCARLG